MIKRERLEENAVSTKGKPHGRPFLKGNPGKPPGAKNKATRLVQELVEGEAEALVRKALELAHGGDVGCLRLLLNLLAPARRGQTISIDIPPVKSAKDLPAVNEAVWAAVNDGEVTANDATALAVLLQRATELFRTEELRSQLEMLEKEEECVPWPTT